MNTMLLFLLFVFPGLMAMEKVAHKELIPDSAYADTSDRPRQTSQGARGTNATDVEKQNMGEKRATSGDSDANKKPRIESEKDSVDMMVAKTSTQEELNKELWKALRSGLTTEVLRLLKEGADHEARNMLGDTLPKDTHKRIKVGDTPLHVAIRKRMRNAIRELIERGADIRAVNSKNETPLADAEPDMALFVQELSEKRDKAPATDKPTASGVLSINNTRSPDKSVGAPIVSGQPYGQVHLSAVNNSAQSTSALDHGKQSSVRAQSAPSQAKTKRKRARMDDDDDDDVMILLKDSGNSVPGLAQLSTPTAANAVNADTSALKQDLFRAVSSGDISRLKEILASGISYKTKAGDGTTILHRAIYHLALIQWIMATYPDLIEEVDNFGNTVLHRAAYSGHFEVVKWLISSCPTLINKQNLKKSTMFHHAVMSGCLPLVQYLVKDCSHCVTLWNDKWSILHLAAAHGKNDVLKWLLEKYPDLRTSLTTDNGCTLIHAAIFKLGTLPTLQYLAEVYPELMLIRDKRYGFTCLHYAVWSNKPDMVQWLAEKYPPLLELRNNKEETALDMARRRDNLNLITILTGAYGKQVQSSNPSTTNAPVSSATVPGVDQSGEQIPSSHGLFSSNQARDLELLAYSDVHKKINGITILHMVLSQDSAFMRHLLEMGADIDSQDNDGNTVLMKAIEIKNDELVRLLLSKKINVDIQNKAGETALILAAKNGLLPTITLLIKKGADIGAKDLQGNTFIAYLEPGIQGLVKALIT